MRLYVSKTYVNVRGRNYNENVKRSAGKDKTEKNHNKNMKVLLMSLADTICNSDRNREKIIDPVTLIALSTVLFTVSKQKFHA